MSRPHPITPHYMTTIPKMENGLGDQNDKTIPLINNKATPLNEPHPKMARPRPKWERTRTSTQ